jgi:exonuclease III
MSKIQNKKHEFETIIIMPIKISTLNSRGGDSKIMHIISIIQRNKIDICLLQETHDMKEENIQKIESMCGAKVFKCKGTKNGRGVTTVVRESDRCRNPRVKYKDDNGNYLLLELQIDQELFQIANIYGPITPQARAKLYHEVVSDTLDKDNRIIGGDFNNIMDFSLDSVGGSRKSFEQRSVDRRKMNEIESRCGYIDTFRKLYPTRKAFTFTGIANYKARLDRIYIHTTNFDKIEKAEITPVRFSDHEMYTVLIKAETEIGRKIWGKGLWKLNKSLMEEPKNLDKIRNVWIEHQSKKPHYKNLMKWWEDAKRLVKDHCIRMGKKAKKCTNETKERYITELRALMADPNACNKEIHQIKNMLREIEEKEIEGAVIRSRKEWQNQGEKCTRYFFNLEKKMSKDKQMDELIDENGKILKTKEDIMNHAKKFYEAEFSESTMDEASYNILLDSITSQLSEEQMNSQAGLFTEAELEKVRKNMKRNKSPGNDGLTIEFYDICWTFIKDDLLEVINEIFCSRLLPISMTQAVITLIYKNKGSRLDLKNWRAISLLNVDYKILSGLLANRIDHLLPELLHEDQVCGVQGRYMEDSLLFFQDLTEQIYFNGGKAMVANLDLKAAFNNINHIYLNGILQRLNIDKQIVRTLNNIYNNMYSAIVINGAKTKYFKLHKSIRQGDKVSMTMFLLAIEPLANIIRRDKKLSPVCLPNTTTKLVCQYCDDTSVLLTKTEDFTRIREHMKIFEDGSGSKFNTDKTEILLIGKWNSEERDKLPSQNIKTEVKILGVWFGNGSAELNEEQILRKIDETLAFWKTMRLSMDGKRLIIQTKILSQIYHIIRITGLSKSLKQKVQSRITKFIWHPKTMSMIAYNTLQNEIPFGGQNMPNLNVINRAILAERIVKVNQGNKPWKGMFIYRVGMSLRDLDSDFCSPRYAHSISRTNNHDIIIDVYNELKTEITDWTKETFKTIKRRLHKNNEYPKRTMRNFTDTWVCINRATSDRKARDLCYLVAHDSLPIATVLANRGINIFNDCKLCGKEKETIRHLFIHCTEIKALKLKIEKGMKILNGRTLGEEEIIFHEGRIKMKKKENRIVAAFKQSIWQARAKLYYGEICQNQLKTDIERLFNSKCKTV